jgi:hypothetical protein
MEDRAVACTWEIHENRGLETAWVTLDGGRLAARGRAVGLAPEPYWVTYTLETGDRHVTRRLAVQVESAAGARSLELQRSPDGSWRADGAALADLAGALDCDLAFSPLTNTMPILRHQLHQRGGAARLAMAWVSLPDLAVSRSEQGYEHLRRIGDGAVVRFTAGSFTADLEVDGDGLVVRYPRLGYRLARAAVSRGQAPHHRAPHQA